MDVKSRKKTTCLQITLSREQNWRRIKEGRKKDEKLRDDLDRLFRIQG